MQKLFDLIDTLLAEREFKATDGAGCTEPAAAADGEGDPIPTASEPEGEHKDNENDPIPTASEPTVNADSVDAMIRDRVQVGMMGQALNLDGLESMKLMDAKKAVIKAVRPNMNLDGKSPVFIDGAYKMACAEVKARNVKDTNYQKRQMFNPATRADAKNGAGNGESAAERRQAMIDRTMKKEEK